ncbi:MAG: hypothetical protein ABIN11_02180 [candidate division WOR-3 bacterium]
MALKFKCSKCENEIIVKFLKIGDIARCPYCGKENVVPDDAIQTSEEKPKINKSEGSLNINFSKNSDDFGLKNVLNNYKYLSILLIFMVLIIAINLIGIKMIFPEIIEEIKDSGRSTQIYIGFILILGIFILWQIIRQMFILDYLLKINKTLNDIKDELRKK